MTTKSGAKQIVILDAEERCVHCDSGTVEECEDGIIVRLTADCSVDTYTLKPSKGPKAISTAQIKDDKLFFVIGDEYLYLDPDQDLTDL